MDRLIVFIKSHKKEALFLAILAILICLCVYFVAQHNKTSQNAAKVVKYEDTTNDDKIAKKLDVDDKTAGQIVEKIEYIHDGKTTPDVTYYVQAPTVEKAAEQTADAINNNDESLPTAVTEKSDRTVVTADTENQKVDVYKINLRNNHKLKAGVLAVDNKVYPGVGYQAGKWEGAAYTNGKRVKAASAMYTIKDW
jgi:hypothetical protein